MRVRSIVSLTTLGFFFAVGAFAQTPPPPPAQPSAQTPSQPPPQTPGAKPPAPQTATPDTPETPKDPNAPLTATPLDPGGNAGASEQQLADPNGQPPGGDYTGPSILSRGFNFARPSIPIQARFRPFFGLNALYDSGLAGPYLGPNGTVSSTSSTALDGSFGISGRKTRRKEAFELDYRGHLYWYSGAAKYNGQDHSLSAGYTRYVSSRLLVSIHEAFGLYSNTYAVLDSTANTDLSTANVSVVVSPNTESFDSRTYFSSTEVDAVYQKTSRLSFNVGVSGFLVKRDSADLANALGYQARADAAYRISSRSTIGIYYGYTTYNFSHVFGNSDVNTLGGEYSKSINKSLSLKLRAGVSRVEVYGLAQVTLDPLIAAILGQSTGIIKYYSVSDIPDFSGSLSKSFRRSNLNFSFSEGVSPGNGLYLTSRHESESVSYSSTLFRKYFVGISGGRDTLGSLGGLAGSYASYYGRLQASRPLRYHLSATLSIDYRNLGFSVTGYGRNEYRISTGITYAPGDGPLKFW